MRVEGAPCAPGHAPYLVGTSCALRTPFSCTLRILVGKNSLYNLPKVLTTVSRKNLLFLFRAVFAADLSNMSSQDSEGESYVADYLVDPKSMGTWSIVVGLRKKKRTMNPREGRR